MATAVSGSGNRAAPHQFRGPTETRGVVGQSPKIMLRIYRSLITDY